jgi:ATP-dependent DNA helicase RecG
MNDFNAPLLSRNPKIMYVFAQIKKAEQRGFGQRTFKAVNDNYGLPKPKYSWNEPFLNITFLLNKDGLKEIIGEDMYYHLNEEERTVLEFVYNKGIIQKSDLIKFLGINDKKAQRILAKFKNLELVEMIGAGPSTHYKFKY